jgi:hypothetical protein
MASKKRDIVTQRRIECAFRNLVSERLDTEQGRKNNNSELNSVYRIGQADRHRKGFTMAERLIKLRLNQQQLELIDRTIAQGVASDRIALVRLALREYAAARKADISAGAGAAQ